MKPIGSAILINTPLKGFNTHVKILMSPNKCVSFPHLFLGSLTSQAMITTPIINTLQKLLASLNSTSPKREFLIYLLDLFIKDLGKREGFNLFWPLFLLLSKSLYFIKELFLKNILKYFVYSLFLIQRNVTNSQYFKFYFDKNLNITPEKFLRHPMQCPYYIDEETKAGRG